MDVPEGGSASAATPKSPEPFTIFHIEQVAYPSREGEALERLTFHQVAAYAESSSARTETSAYAKHLDLSALDPLEA